MERKPGYQSKGSLFATLLVLAQAPLLGMQNVDRDLKEAFRGTQQLIFLKYYLLKVLSCL